MLSRSEEVDLLISGTIEKAVKTPGLDENNWVVVAVGGYGRCQLAPFSDIDLAVIDEGLSQEDEKNLVQAVYYPLWDAKLSLGHTVRSQRESVAFGREDLHWLTACLDARFLGGDKGLYNVFTMNLFEVAGRKRGRLFLKELITDSRQRWRRSGYAGRLREPELKDGHGGLRDVQVIRWAAEVIGRRAGTTGQGLKAASDLGLISPKDVLDLEKAQDFLWQLRCYLHESAGKGLDRLIFGHQDAVADRFFPEKGDALILLGRLLYKSTRDVARIISSFFEQVEHKVLKKKAAFSGAESRLEILRERLTIDSLLEILRMGRKGLRELECLGYGGDLESLLPEWKNIVGLTSRDANHRHPVDTHSFYTVVELVDIADRKVASSQALEGIAVKTSDNYLASQVYEEIAHPDWLLLTGLLHDIGKGQNGSHSSTGAVLTSNILNLAGAERHASETISFLVKNHLTLSHVSTRRDLNDIRVIDELVSLVGDGDRLKMLYLLTIADARATGPKAWNSWKSSLVRELFLKTLARLDGETSLDNSMQIDFEEKHFDLLDSESEVEISFWPQKKGDLGELGIVAPDRPGLFNRIAGVLSLNHLNVLASRIYTTDNGRALEVFKVAPTFESVVSEKTIDRIRKDINSSLSGQMALSYRMDELSSRYKKKGEAQPPARVAIENVSSDDYTIVEVYAMDEIGLLYKITSALFELNLDIHFAKISTFGNEAIDVFYVSDLKGRKITAEEDLSEIKKNILFRLSSRS